MLIKLLFIPKPYFIIRKYAGIQITQDFGKAGRGGAEARRMALAAELQGPAHELRMGRRLRAGAARRRGAPAAPEWAPTPALPPPPGLNCDPKAADRQAYRVQSFAVKIAVERLAGSEALSSDAGPQHSAGRTRQVRTHRGRVMR